jgi:hypothetical protein
MCVLLAATFASAGPPPTLILSAPVPVSKLYVGPGVACSSPAPHAKQKPVDAKNRQNDWLTKVLIDGIEFFI